MDMPRQKTVLAVPDATGIADWIGPKPGDASPIIYFSGIPRSAKTTEEEFLRIGCRHRCLSYAYCGNDTGLYSQANREALDFCVTHDVRVFFDSGAHTFQNLLYGRKKFGNVQRASAKSTVEQLVLGYCDKYAEFIKAYTDYYGPFDFAVTFDYIHDCKEIRRVTEYLYSLGARIVPVYHGDSGLEWLDRYRDDGHKLIGISWSNATKGGKHRRQYYDRVFNWGAKNSIKFHGFAQTGRAMFEHPWYSVDSSSWLKVAAYGSIIDTSPTGNGQLRLRVMHISDVMSNASKPQAFALKNLPPAILRDLRNRVEQKGYDLDTLQTSLDQRALYNVSTFLSVSANYKLRKEASPWERLL